MMNATCDLIQAGLLEESNLPPQVDSISPEYARLTKYSIRNRNRDAAVTFRSGHRGGKPTILAVDFPWTQSNGPNTGSFNEPQLDFGHDVIAELRIGKKPRIRHFPESLSIS
jgi:hypothetical protein